MATVRGISCFDLIVPVTLSTMAYDQSYRNGDVFSLSLPNVSSVISDFIANLQDCSWKDETIQVTLSALVEMAFSESIVARMYDNEMRGSVPSTFSKVFNVSPECITNIRPFFVKKIAYNAPRSWYDSVIHSEKHRNAVTRILFGGKTERAYREISRLIFEVKEDDEDSLFEDSETFTVDLGRETGDIRIRLYGVSCPRCIIALIDAGCPIVDNVYDKESDQISLTYLVLTACDDYFNPTCCLPKEEHNHDVPVKSLKAAVIHLNLKGLKDMVSEIILGRNNFCNLMNNRISVYVDYREYNIAK